MGEKYKAAAREYRKCEKRCSKGHQQNPWKKIKLGLNLLHTPVAKKPPHTRKVAQKGQQKYKTRRKLQCCSQGIHGLFLKQQMCWSNEQGWCGNQ
jgi:hypothetical protein